MKTFDNVENKSPGKEGMARLPLFVPALCFYRGSHRNKYIGVNKSKRALCVRIVASHMLESQLWQETSPGLFPTICVASLSLRFIVCH